MQALKTLTLLVGLGFASGSEAINYNTCKSKLYETLERIENTGHSPVLAKPKGDLLQLSERFEILCPWQIEADFNGDGKKDWAGILQKDGKYELVAYLSGPRKHEVSILKQYSKFPSDTFFTRTSYKWLFKTSKGKIPSTFPAKLILSENNTDGSAVAYGWVDKELKNIHSYKHRITLDEPTESNQ